MITNSASYNPDVLSCLANLSNDEVFTPPDVVNDMLDMLPDSLWQNPDATFLDPCCKTGVFLREIAKRLNTGLASLPEYAGDQNLQKRLDHIFKTQLYGIAITELTSLLSRRSVYCSKTANGKYSVTTFDSENGHIYFSDCAHTWQNGKCTFCGASESEYGSRENLESHAYQFIHNATPEEFNNMKFDVIIGNPPYQLSTGGSGAQAKPIYQLFVKESKKLNPRYLSMIMPSRWFSGGMGLDDFRNEMLHDKHISKFIDYSNAKDCFPENSISGGVCYFLREKDKEGLCYFTNIKDGKQNSMERNLSEFPVLVRYNDAVLILRKVIQKNENSLSKIVSSLTPFGLSTNIRGTEKTSSNDDLLLHASDGVSFINKMKIQKGSEFIGKYKVLISKTSAEHAGEPSKDGKYRIITSSMKVIGPNEICTHSYFLIGNYSNKTTADNLYNYLCTKFVRFLILQSMSSINLSKSVFQFVPMQDFSDKSDIDWSQSVNNIDQQLYKKYNLTQEEISFIESMIRPMDSSSEGSENE